VPTKSIVLVVWAALLRSSRGLRLRKTATSQNREIQFPRLGDRKKYASGAVAERLSQRRAFCLMPRRILHGHFLTIPKNPKAKYNDPDTRVETSNLKPFQPSRSFSLPLATTPNLGRKKIEPAHVQQMDSIKHIDEMREVGRAMAAQKVSTSHFAGFPVQAESLTR
jgi:hypothetical protein